MLEGDSATVPLGVFPTPVQRIDALSTAECELWIKRDDLTHPVYGGNKVRKLEHVLAAVKKSGAVRIVTVGGAGSHHVLATTYFGRLAGIVVEAVLVPQPRTTHVAEILRADVALGLRPFPVRSWSAAPWRVVRRMARGARFVTVGGSSVAGSMGYVTAARELATQVRNGVMPEPDVCVVALGSGGTAAGLAAGFEAERLKTQVIGVCVSPPAAIVGASARWLAWACARRAGVPSARWSMRRRIHIDPRFLGAGYGHATAAGDEATRMARGSLGLVLDPTYTAKAFASALAHVRAATEAAGERRHGTEPGPERPRCILYWHTLSSAPLAPLLVGAPDEGDLPPPLRRLMQ